MNTIIQKTDFFLLSFLILLVLIAGAFTVLIDVDSAQYAAISMEMIKTYTFLEVYQVGIDYLDKPPLLFWLGAIFYGIFGIEAFAFKLPTILFTLISFYYLYKLSLSFFNKWIACCTILVYASTLGLFWINSDVKTDSLVTSCILISVYFLFAYVQKSTITTLIIGSAFIGLALMSKGPMGLVFPLTYIGFHLLITKNWNGIFKFSWLILPITAALVISPMLFGLYNQFDLHPEKIVNGKEQVSGLRFFFWEQSFGRITGENKYKNETSFFFLFHCLFLLIIPYSLILFSALYNWFKDLTKNNSDQNTHWLYVGSVVILCALSLSTYKIPHYTSVLFPFCSIIIAKHLYYLTEKDSSKFLVFNNLLMLTIVVSLISLSFYCFNPNLFAATIITFVIILSIYNISKHKQIISLALCGIALGLLFNMHIIPSLHDYTPGKRFAELVQSKNIDPYSIYYFNRESHAMEFYLQTRIQRLTWNELISKNLPIKDKWIYLEESAIEALKYQDMELVKKECLSVYDLNRINLKFLIPKTREDELDTYCLAMFSRKK